MSLSKKQRSFVDRYLETLNAKQSALDVGYAESVAHNAAVIVLGSTSVRQEIENRLVAITEENALMFVQGARKAIRVLLEIIDDPEAPASAKVAACKEILDRGSHIARFGLEGEVGSAVSEAARKFDHILSRFKK